MRRRRLALAPLFLMLALAAIIVVGVIAASNILSPSGFVLRASLPQVARGGALPVVEGSADWPLVVIDPGHGGHDPGASGSGFEEKAVVLGLAQSLKQELERGGGVRVALTREDDRYLLHSERFEIARRLDADLFISLHADSAGEIDGVGGASIYTLSDRASSDAAARYAARENASDQLNGIDLEQQSDAVGTLLVELAQRRTSAQSDEFAALVRREAQDVVAFHPQARRYAALKVLRAPDVPSILFESGFITNAADAERLTSPRGRDAFAKALASAIRIFLATRGTGASEG